MTFVSFLKTGAGTGHSQTNHVQDRCVWLDRYLPGTVYDFSNVFSLEGGGGVSVRGPILVNGDKSLGILEFSELSVDSS